MKQFIKNITPHFIKRFYRKFVPVSKQYGWFGNYLTWEEANAKCKGYDDNSILEKVLDAVLKVKKGEAVYERDSVLFDTLEYSPELLSYFLQVAEKMDNRLYVLDFGGSLGSTYFQNISLLKSISNIKWSVVEQKHFVDAGKKYIETEQLKFYYTIAEALKNNNSDLLLLSSVLPYFEKPYELIDELIHYGLEYIIIDRTPFVNSAQERITIQIVPETIYKASYPAWFFNEQKLVNAFLPKYSLIGSFDCKFDPKENLDDGVFSYRKGFVFRKK